jgi:hypothetical protein
MTLAAGNLAKTAAPTLAHSALGSPGEREALLALASIAAHTVAPLWPLDSAIAVNPLAGFEDLPFEDAVPQAAALHGARATLSLPEWRSLLAEGRINDVALRKTVVQALGGLEAAFDPLVPELNAYDLLIARLVTLDAEHAPPVRRALSPAVAMLARWLGRFSIARRRCRCPAVRAGSIPACSRRCATIRRWARAWKRPAPPGWPARPVIRSRCCCSAPGARRYAPNIALPGFAR